MAFASAEAGAASLAPLGLVHMKLEIEFSGGLELLFGKQKLHKRDVPTTPANAPTMKLRDVVVWIRDNMLQERPDLFITHGSVRPGILVLINDGDWELTGGMDSAVEDGDTIVFISTLHGG